MIKQHFKNLIVLIAEAIDDGGFAFIPNELDHAVQFRLLTGDILNVYATGTLQWQGKRSEHRAELEEIAAKAHRRWVRRPRERRVARTQPVSVQAAKRPTLHLPKPKLRLPPPRE